MSRFPGPTFKRGATYRRLLVVRSGDASIATASAVIKDDRNGLAPGDDVPVLATFEVTYLPNVDPEDLTSDPAFLFTLPPTETAGMTAGIYVMDARIEIGSDVIATATEKVTVEERVTEDA